MDWEDQRDQMVKRQLVSRGIKNERVLEAMGKYLAIFLSRKS